MGFALCAIIILSLKLTAQTEDVLNPTSDKIPQSFKEVREMRSATFPNIKPFDTFKIGVLASLRVS
jgi:hypothetical protein